MAVVMVVFAYQVYPLPGTDSVVFLITATRYAKGLGLTNPYYYLTSSVDPTQTGSFDYYPPLFPLIVGAIGKIAPYVRTIFLICSIFSIGNLWFLTRGLNKILASKRNFYHLLVAVLSIFYCAVYFLPTIGRPEVLASLLVMIEISIYQNKKKLRPLVFNLLTTFVFSAILCTQLICFYFAFTAFLIYECKATPNVWAYIRDNALRAVSVVVLAGLILYFSPHGLLTTLEATKVHIGIATGRTDRSIGLFLYYWVANTNAVGFLFVFLAALFFYCQHLVGEFWTFDPARRWLLGILHLAIVVGIIKFVLYASPTVYNLTVFIIPITLYLIDKITNTEQATLGKFFVYVMAITFLAGVGILARWVFLLNNAIQTGRDFETCRTKLKPVTGGLQGVYISNMMWPLIEDTKKLLPVYYTTVPKESTMLIQEANGTIPNTLIEGNEIILDYRTEHPAKFAGMRLTNHAQNYAFIAVRKKH